MRENCLYWVWLTTLRGLSFVKIQALLDYFKTIENVYNAKEEDYLQVSAIRKNDISRLLDKNTQKAEQIIKRMEDIGGYILTIDDEEYPQRLKDLENPPCVLYVRGKLFDFLQCATIGVVGTRECSDYGAVVTKRMSYELARGGAVIVSGMARGIDTYAAYSALRAGARTVAVLGCGVDVIYPPENVDIMNAIIKNGAVVSEYPPMSPPLGIHFPQRNRIIAGLCDGLLVTEAPYGSGALITAKCAYDINRKIYSVPGSVFSKESAGTNALIKKGAIAATHPNDILSDFPKDILDNEKNNLNMYFPQRKRDYFCRYFYFENILYKILKIAFGLNLTNLYLALNHEVFYRTL